MSTAKIVFLWPLNKNDLLGKLIQFGEGGTDEPTHVAVVLADCLLEATAIGVRKTPLDRYAKRRREIWEISVLQPELSNIAAIMLEGRKYSYFSCVAGLLRDKFNIKLPFINACQDDCSHVGTIWLRCQNLGLFGTDNPATVTPKDLYLEIQRWGARCVEKWPIPN